MPYGNPKGNYGMSTKGRTSGKKSAIHHTFGPVKGGSGKANVKTVSGGRGPHAGSDQYGSSDAY